MATRVDAERTPAQREVDRMEWHLARATGRMQRLAAAQRQQGSLCGVAETAKGDALVKQVAQLQRALLAAKQRAYDEMRAATR